VKVVTISSSLNFGGPAPPGRGSAAERKFVAPPYYSQRAVFASPLSAFFIDSDSYDHNRRIRRELNKLRFSFVVTLYVNLKRELFAKI